MKACQSRTFLFDIGKVHIYYQMLIEHRTTTSKLPVIDDGSESAGVRGMGPKSRKSMEAMERDIAGIKIEEEAALAAAEMAG